MLAQEIVGPADQLRGVGQGVGQIAVGLLHGEVFDQQIAQAGQQMAHLRNGLAALLQRSSPIWCSKSRKD